MEFTHQGEAMTKTKFIDLCTKLGLAANYNGNTRTVHVSGANAHRAIKHMAFANFNIKIVSNEIKS